jgi:tetratricopeptide (TPR) repeat protein
VGAPRQSERLPDTVETWLLAPDSAPDFSLPDLGGRVWTLSSLRPKPVLLSFLTSHAGGSAEDLAALRQLHAGTSPQDLQLLTINVDEGADGAGLVARSRDFVAPILRGSDDVAGVYNLLFRGLFDRRRDLGIPASFLIAGNGDIVKVYQGRINPAHVEQDFRAIPQSTADRLAKALPFAGVSDTYEFGRNYLSYGTVFFQQGYFDQAEAAFRAALRDDPSSAEAHYGLGSACLKLQRTAEARESFERAAKLHASYPATTPNAFNNLGLLATREGRTSAPSSIFRRPSA